ncbi:MAG TPA: hypothetical protein VEK07_02480 [Polyangiaceae bacterium]|nr:hypothetical protein [Polyangiaceae bacterium]
MPADKIDVSKTEFILSQPPDLHAADVVVNARDAGLAIDLPLVYSVRARAGARRRARTRSAVKNRAAPKGSATPKSTAMVNSPNAAVASKADFVRARTKLSPKEIVAQAKSAGMELGVGYVYNVRSADKAKRMPAAKKRSPLVFAKAERVSVSKRNEEGLLKMLAAEIGLGRAIDVLRAERSRVTAIFAG